MKYTEEQIQQAIALLEAFLEDKNSMVQKATTLLDFPFCEKPILQIRNEYLHYTLWNADISPKAFNVLRSLEMTTVSDLVNYCNCYGLDRLANLGHMGKKSYEEIRAYLTRICIDNGAL
jgi:hypothetical protein